MKGNWIFCCKKKHKCYSLEYWIFNFKCSISSYCWFPINTHWQGS